MFAFKSMVPRVSHGFAKDFEPSTNFAFHLLATTHTHKLTNTKVLRAAWHWKYVTSRTIESYSNVCKIDGRWKVTQWSKQWWHKILQQWWMVTHPSRWKIFQSFKVPHPSVPSFEVRVVEPKAISSVPRTETQFFRGNFQELCRIKGRTSRKNCNFLLILTPFDPRHSRIWKLSAFFDRDLTAIVSAIVSRADIKPRNEGMSQRRMSQCKNAGLMGLPLTQEGLQVCDVASMGILVINECNPLRFLRLNKNRGVDLLLQWCNSGNLGERCDLFKLCCHHHWSQLWSWMWWKYDQSCQHVDPAKSCSGWDWLTLDLVPKKWMLPNAGRCQVAVYQGGYLLSTIVLWRSTLWKLL